MIANKNNHLSGVMNGLVLLALAASLPLRAAQPQVAVVGPVDTISCSLKAVTVLGVSFTAVSKDVSRHLCSSDPIPGISYVSAVGVFSTEGVIELHGFNLLSREGYVPGVSPVYARGVVTWVNDLTGQFSIRGAVFNVSDALPSLGDFIEVTGSQPMTAGLVLSDAVRVLEGANVNSSVGSGIQTHSSVGSGVLSNSSVGSGIQTRSSVGSGVLSNSSVGSGVRTQSSVGSGVLTNSSVGSGIQANSSVGSGIQLNSSVGSGVLALAQ